MRGSSKLIGGVVALSLVGCVYVVAPPQPAPVVDAPAPPPPPPPAPVVAYQPPPPEVAPLYQDQLSPYGRWIVDPRYGSCWIPNANFTPVGWQPYTVGHWVYTDDGSSYWVCDGEEGAWGNITYHYGQWVFTADYGWIWVPGTVWAPAWVAWREGGGYCGWAVLPPEACQGDVTVVVVDRYCPPDRFVFVDERNFGEPRINRHFVHADVTIINNTTNITNVTIVDNRVVNRGVPADHIERITGRAPERLHLAEASNPEEARRLALAGTPVRYSSPAIEQVHTRVVQQRAQLQAEHQRQADQQKQVELDKQAADQHQRELNQQRVQEQQREHDQQLQADQAAKRSADEQRAHDQQAQQQAQRDAQLQRQQQEQAAKQSDRDKGNNKQQPSDKQDKQDKDKKPKVKPGQEQPQ